MNLDINELRQIKEKIRTLDLDRQKEEIRKASPYSSDITDHIRTYEELHFYHSLHLQESYLTRPVLITDIDPDLWIESEKATNLELMSKGRPPYAYDAPEGKVELHHIGQNFTSPFVELTQAEHEQNSHILHISDLPSWRNDAKLERAFQAERKSHWIKRAQGEFVVDELPDTPIEVIATAPHQDYLTILCEICEEIYKQSRVSELDYLADLARSYSMMQRIGSLSMGEFIKNIRSEQNHDIRCASCAKSDYVHYGTYHSQGEDIQRYKCKICGKVFTATAKTLISGTSFSFRNWIKFIDCLYNGFTLGEIARICGVSEKTVIDNRTKLFYALKLLNDRVVLNGHIAIDETFLAVSFKGNHSKQEGFVMPRDAHSRGGENHEKGITNNLVCVVCAIDDAGNSVCKVIGTGNSSAAKLKYALKPHFGENVVRLYSDKSAAIKCFAKQCGYDIKQEKQLRKGSKLADNVTISHDAFVVNRYIQIANSYHSRFKRFIRRFSGISTKYLSGYAYLFAWKERNKGNDPIDAYKELLRIMTEPNHYLSANEIMERGHLPDALQINDAYRKKGYIPSERDLEIRKQYNAGNTMACIGEESTLTRQCVSLIIKKLKQAGYTCSPANDIPRKQPTTVSPYRRVDKGVVNTLLRDYQIYYAKQQWTGSATEFDLAMSAKYGISVQRVKNIVALIQRYIRLKEEMYIYEDVSYQSLEEVYRSVYSDYSAMTHSCPELPKGECVRKLAEKYSFKPSNITRILDIMTTDSTEAYFSKKRKLSVTETFNRDKAIFIDFLRWSGKRSDFCRYASAKYHLSHGHVNTILKYCLYADPKRFEMV